MWIHHLLLLNFYNNFEPKYFYIKYSIQFYKQRVKITINFRIKTAFLFLNLINEFVLKCNEQRINLQN